MPIVAQFGSKGVLVVAMLAGLILIGLALLGAGRFMRYLPLPVVERFTVGIAVITGLQQLPSGLGVHAHADKVLLLTGRALRAWSAHPHWAPTVTTFCVAGCVLLGSAYRPVVPVSLLAVVGATVTNPALGLRAETIGAIPALDPGRQHRPAATACGRRRSARRTGKSAVGDSVGRDDRRASA